MKLADIEAGKLYKAKAGWPLYGACVRVIEVGSERPKLPYRSRVDGVRVEIVRVCSLVTCQSVGSSEIVTAGALDRHWTVGMTGLAHTYTRTSVEA